MRSKAVVPSVAEQQKTMAQIASGAASLPDSGLVVFKSVIRLCGSLTRFAVQCFRALLRPYRDLPGALDGEGARKGNLTFRSAKEKEESRQVTTDVRTPAP